MFHPSRGGVRGGQDQFSWDDVKEDKYRENYLGHSLKAPVGRWQKGKDLTWYAKDENAKNEERARELQAIKDAEEDAMLEALGHPVKKRRVANNQLDDKELKNIIQKGNRDNEEDGFRQDGFEIKGLGFKDSFSKSLTGKVESTKFTSTSEGQGHYTASGPQVPSSMPADDSEAGSSPRERTSHSKHKGKKKEKKSKSKHKHKHKHKNHKKDSEDESTEEKPHKRVHRSPSNDLSQKNRRSRHDRYSRSPSRSNLKSHPKDSPMRNSYRDSRSRRDPSPVSRSRYSRERSRERSRRYSRSRSPVRNDRRYYDRRG